MASSAQVLVISDMIRDTDDDSGLRVEIECPVCEREHTVAIQKHGRFIFECQQRWMKGIIQITKLGKAVH